MKSLHVFTIKVIPKPLQTSGKRLVVVNGKPRFFKSSAATAYQREIALQSARHLPAQPHEGPLSLRLSFVLPRPQRVKGGCLLADKRPDLDNLIKGTQDALAGFWRDDAQIVCLIAGKKYAPEGHFPCIGVTICDATSLFDDAQ
jgi:Holliday junction resolvase RusA-like endonuclease